MLSLKKKKTTSTILFIYCYESYHGVENIIMSIIM